MESAVRPSTPINKSLSVTSTPQTGTWIHPCFDEITRRQSAKAFTDRNIKKILYNLAGLFVIWLTEKIMQKNFGLINRFSERFHPYTTYVFILVRCVFMFNIAIACLPLTRRRDDLSDIPLTPTQRKLLGLPPSNTPPTSRTDYVTPPRYRRSSSASPSSVYSHSPLSGKGSPAQSSPYSPSNPSPLRHKVFPGGILDARRNSYGSPSPMAGRGSTRTDIPSTPSPLAGKGVPLNSKWLYEKKKASGGDSILFS